MGLGRDWRRLIWGVVLMLYGGLFLADYFGLLPQWAQEFRWWPLIVITIGLSKLILPRSANEIGICVQVTLLGLWFLFVIFPTTTRGVVASRAKWGDSVIDMTIS